MLSTLFTHIVLRTSHKRRLEQAGFTLLELLLVMGLFALLIGITTFDLFNAQRQSQLASGMNTFLSDVKAQQVKAMTGDTDGQGSASSYGVYFSTNSYTLFKGSVYDPASSSNFVVTLPTSVVFQTINLPGSSLIFNGDGTISGYSNTQNSVIMRNTNGSETKTILFNSLGVITQVN